MLVRGVGCTGSSVVVLVSSNDAWEVFTVGWDKPDKVPTEEEEEEVDEDGLLWLFPTTETADAAADDDGGCWGVVIPSFFVVFVTTDIEPDLPTVLWILTAEEGTIETKTR
jgi:hypothetical protein